MNLPRAPRPLRVLVIHDQTDFWSMGEGAGATAFIRTMQSLAARGHDVHVSLPAAPGGTRAVDRETIPGVALHRFPGRRFLPDPNRWLLARLWDRWTCWRAYLRAAEDEAIRVGEPLRPELVLGLGPFEAPVGRSVGRRFGVPNVTRLFGTNLGLNLRDPFRFYANFPEVAAFRSDCSYLLLTNDGGGGAAVARRLGVPSGRFRHWRNGLEFDRFSPGPPSVEVRRRLGLEEGDQLLMTVTRLAPEKKLERAVHLLARLRQTRPDTHLALLGDGPERARIASAVARAGQERHVHFVGPIRNTDLPDWYRTADVVLSLLDRTNASNPVFEAMACGRLVAALDVGTTNEVVLHGVTGLLRPPEQLTSLAADLSELLASPTRRRSLETAAVTHVQSILRTPAERLLDEMELYESAVGDPAHLQAGVPSGGHP